MTKINLLKPDNNNLLFFLTLGLVFFSFGILDFYLNNFLNINITSFLPRIINFFIPLIFAVIGLHFIRIEFSGIKILDNINKNIICFHSGTKKHEGNLVTNGGRVIVLSTLNKTIKESRANIYEEIDKVKFEGSFYRSDIALKAVEND